MPNPITQFIQDRIITPAVQAQLPTVERATDAFAVGVLPQASTTLRDALGQAPDTDYDLLYAVTNNHADVSACVAIWAGGVTGNGWHIGLLDREAEPNRNQRKQIDEITTWLKNPNPTKRFSRLLYELVAHMAITGDSYLNKVTDGQGRIIELWGVHPATLRIVADEHGEIVGYVQRVQGNRAEFTPAEISRLQLPSVFNDLYGHSPLESVLQEVHTDLSALRSNRAIIENGFKPSVILMMKDGVKEAAERISALIKQKHSGAKNAHGIMTVSGVEKIEQYSSSLKDMEFSALRTLTTEKVATAFRVPKFMLNQKESADLATSAVQERQFFNGTIKPIQDIVAEVLTEEVIHTFNDELAFYFNEPDFNNADALRRDALVAEGQNILTDDEVRTRFFDLPIKTPEQRKAEEEARAQMQAQVQPQNRPQQQPQDSGQADREAGTEATDAPKKSIAKALTRADVEEIRQRREGIHDQLEADIQPSVVAFFERQEGRYLDRLATTFKSTRSAVKKGILDNLIATYFTDTEGDDRELGILLFGELEASLNAGANEAQLQLAFTLDTEAQAAIVDEYLLKNALAHAKGINETTKGQLTETLRAGIADGEGIPELRARVKSVFTQASANRANTIARTETAQAFEYANERAMMESGVVAKQSWLSARDERIRESHRLLDGMIVPLGEKFPSINGPISPGEEVNCRCSSIGIVDETL